ncbi:MAG: hypothetical protein KGK14_02780, partial [Bacteroidota bacterium]|nr:hypothetical protein [Bacteroidota bacterium]
AVIMAIIIAMPLISNAQTSTKKSTKEKKETPAKKAKKTTLQQQNASPNTTASDVSKSVKPASSPTKNYTKQATSANAGNDKVIGKDDKGRTIYEGKRGGHYYINSNGNKTYIKKN